MRNEARVSRLVAVFGKLPNDDKDLVLRISEMMRRENPSVAPGERILHRASGVEEAARRVVIKPRKRRI